MNPRIANRQKRECNPRALLPRGLFCPRDRFRKSDRLSLPAGSIVMIYAIDCGQLVCILFFPSCNTRGIISSIHIPRSAFSTATSNNAEVHVNNHENVYCGNSMSRWFCKSDRIMRVELFRGRI